jgi:hypothetical protein
MMPDERDAERTWLWYYDDRPGGYAPDQLQEALLEWICLTLPGGPESGPPEILIDGVARPFTWLCDQLRECHDVLPTYALGDIEEMLGLPLTRHTYATAAHVLKAAYVEAMEAGEAEKGQQSG